MTYVYILRLKDILSTYLCNFILYGIFMTLTKLVEKWIQMHVDNENSLRILVK